ncbi:MAG: DUF6893 family small protein [Egibacteraceae bacterium]
MLGKLIGSALLVGVAALVVTSMPDLARYLRLRDM